MLSIRGSSSTTRTRAVWAGARVTVWANNDKWLKPCPGPAGRLALLEGERQVGTWQVVRAADPARRAAATVLTEEAAAARLLLQVWWQIRRTRAEDDLLQLVGKQQWLGADPRAELQDDPLEAHVDEVAVGRMGLRMGDGRSQHFESAARREGWPEVARLAVELIRGDGLDERQNVRVFRRTDCRRLRLQLIVWRREHAAVDARVREDLGIQQVDDRRARTRAELDDQALEHLHRATQEGEQARHGEAEGIHLTTRLEEGHGLVVHAEAGLAIELRIMRDGRRRRDHWRRRGGRRAGRARGGGGSGRRDDKRAHIAAVGDDLAAVVREAEEHELGIGQIDMALNGVAAAPLAPALLGRTQIGNVGAGKEVQVGIIGGGCDGDADGGVRARVAVVEAVPDRLARRKRA